MESLIATTIFWVAFVFSPSAFWVALMASAEQTPLRMAYKNYTLYVTFGWGPQVILISLLTGAFIKSYDGVLAALYFVGGAIILMLAIQSIIAKRKNAALDFTWRKMIAVASLNPKVYLTVPTGALSANYTDLLLVNAVIFSLISLPLCFIAVAVWHTLGKVGAKFSAGKFVYFTTALMVGYAIYLFREGVVSLATGI